MKIGIVGHGSDKFTSIGEEEAKCFIDDILNEGDILVSGHSPVGGIDIWAEENARKRNISTDIKIPKQNQWDAEYGFKQRNLDIAKDSDVVYVLVVRGYPEGYEGRTFLGCYHCKDRNLPHVKSGGCWTGWKAKEMGKEVYWIIIHNYGSIQ